MKKEKNNLELNKKRGARLQKCRKAQLITRKQLAEALPCSETYIGMLENGVRPIDWDKAQALAPILKVSPAYIMCETDVPMGSRPQVCDPLCSIDNLFINFIISSGHTILFHVVNLYDGQKPKTKTYNGQSYIDWSSLQIDAQFSELKNLCLSNTHCNLLQNDTISEVAVVAVTLDGVKMSYGRFVFFITQLYNYINYTFSNLKELQDSLDYASAQNSATQNEIEETRNSAFDQKIIVDAITSAEKQDGKVIFDDKMINMIKNIDIE